MNRIIICREPDHKDLCGEGSTAGQAYEQYTSLANPNEAFEPEDLEWLLCTPYYVKYNKIIQLDVPIPFPKEVIVKKAKRK